MPSAKTLKGTHLCIQLNGEYEMTCKACSPDHMNGYLDFESFRTASKTATLTKKTATWPKVPLPNFPPLSVTSFSTDSRVKDLNREETKRIPKTFSLDIKFVAI